ncbi:hypothetical protein H1Q63_10610 [Desmonostoc muscorum CCALA 125]|nr:hypothetical protein [Desmonostoc muscorum CCALA 125]
MGTGDWVPRIGALEEAGSTRERLTATYSLLISPSPQSPVPNPQSLVPIKIFVAWATEPER